MATTSVELPVILYSYEYSPCARKTENLLHLKGVAFRQVNVPPALPRPDIDILGVAYRRIPILAIGRDVYCDTSLIALALERRFPPSAGYGTIFPKTKHGGHVDTGLATAFSQQIQNALSPLVTSFLPWDRFSESFLQDRASFFGAPIDPQVVIASRRRALSSLSYHLSLLEGQLTDGREWLLNTEQPGLVDISYYFILSWVQVFSAAKSLNISERFPKVAAWLERLSAFLKNRQQKMPALKVISGEEAASLIVSSTYESLNFIGFDQREASLLGVQQNETVLIAPTDTGTNQPTKGKLLALSVLEMVIEVSGLKGTLRCHFPRLSFYIKPVERGRL